MDGWMYRWMVYGGMNGWMDVFNQINLKRNLF